MYLMWFPWISEVNLAVSTRNDVGVYVILIRYNIIIYDKNSPTKTENRVERRL